ncbi:unnamed protein product [Ectocarpus sp. 8 AP-2014]
MSRALKSENMESTNSPVCAAYRPYCLLLFVGGGGQASVGFGLAWELLNKVHTFDIYACTHTKQELMTQARTNIVYSVRDGCGTTHSLRDVRMDVSTQRAREPDLDWLCRTGGEELPWRYWMDPH